MDKKQKQQMLTNENKIGNHFYRKDFVARKPTLRVSAYYIQVDIHRPISKLSNRRARYANTLGFKLGHKFNTLVCQPVRMHNLKQD